MRLAKTILLMAAGGTLSGCLAEDGLRAYSGPNDYIAVAVDRGRDSDSNANDRAAIAVTPDGCQAWVIDDGVEGRASNRLDPVTGLPVCVGEPGVVYGPYQSGTEGITDYVPGNASPTRTEQVAVRPTTGHYHLNGEYHTGHTH